MRIEHVDYINLAQNKIQWRTFLNTEINILVP
jgi:hypothetical protein